MEKTIDKIDKDKPTQLFALLKFGKLKNLKNLQENGTLYLSPIEKLRQNDNHRDDSYEGANFVRGFFGGGTLKCEIPGKEPINLNFISGSYKESHEIVLGNICSFYAISSNDFIDGKFVPVDSQMKEFGEYCMLITDMNKFFNMIHDKIKDLKKNCYHGMVKYYDERNYEGKIDLFQKRIKYQYQKEYRIYIPSNRKKKALKIHLGSLKDISIIGDSATIHQFTFTPKYSNTLST